MKELVQTSVLTESLIKDFRGDTFRDVSADHVFPDWQIVFFYSFEVIFYSFSITTSICVFEKAAGS